MAISRPTRQPRQLRASLDALRSGGPSEAFMSAVSGSMAGAFARLAATHPATAGIGLRLREPVGPRRHESQCEKTRRRSSHCADESHGHPELRLIVARKDQISSIPAAWNTTGHTTTAKRNSYTSAPGGGGRCRTAPSEDWAVAASARLGTVQNGRNHGAMVRVDGGTNPTALPIPKVTRSQSLPHRSEKAGPARVLACSLQQHLPWLRQQDEKDGAADRSDGKEAVDTSRARHAANTLRLQQTVPHLPSILWRRSIPRGRDAATVAGGRPGGPWSGTASSPHPGVCGCSRAREGRPAIGRRLALASMTVDGRHVAARSGEKFQANWEMLSRMTRH